MEKSCFQGVHTKILKDSGRYIKKRERNLEQIARKCHDKTRKKYILLTHQKNSGKHA